MQRSTKLARGRARYEFRTAEGQVCCQTNEAAHLCADCAALASRSVPPPPDLAAAIRAARSASPATRQQRLDEFFAGPRPLADGRLP